MTLSLTDGNAMIPREEELVVPAKVTELSSKILFFVAVIQQVLDYRDDYRSRKNFSIIEIPVIEFTYNMAF